MTQSRFTVTADPGRQPPTVLVAGEIDLANVAEFEKALVRAGGRAPALTVDLSAVSYCDSAALRALFALAADTELTLVVGSSGTITTLLGISGLDRVATVVVGG